jgi:sugar (pentulose or hexulose) kinase
VHVTDVTNASRTMLFNIHTMAWDDELLRLLGVPAQHAAGGPRLERGVRPRPDIARLGDWPIAGIAGDQQAALFGQMCVAPGLTKNTYGTGCFLLQNTGTEAGRLAAPAGDHVAWQIGDRTEYALEGSVFIGGAVVQWLRDGLGLIGARRTSRRWPRVGARQRRRLPRAGLRRAGGAALGSVRARHDRRHHARHDAGHIARAALESIAYQVGDLLDAVQRDSGIALKRAARGRRRGGQRPADAVPGRPARRAGRAAGGHRDHGARRGLPGRARRRFWPSTRRDRRAVAGRSALRARHGAASRGSRCGSAGARRHGPGLGHGWRPDA